MFILWVKCIHVSVNALTYSIWIVCAPSEAYSIARLPTGWHAQCLVEDSDKPVLWPLAFLCQNSTRGAQEQRIVGHGNVYLPCSHPDQQLCSSGPEKHWLCKLSPSQTQSQIGLVFVLLPKKLKPESTETMGRTVFCVHSAGLYFHSAFTLHALYRRKKETLVELGEYNAHLSFSLTFTP